MHKAFAVVLLVGCSESGSSPPPPRPDPAPIAAADVSVLYPLDGDNMLRPSEEGAHGALLPQELVSSRLPIDYDDTYDQLRLISFRIDPCGARTGCASEVRAVFQPMNSRNDGAFHVFYAVPLDELVELQREILVLKAEDGNSVAYPEALGRHPILVARGLTSPFALGLKDALLEHLGADRIERITSFDHTDSDGDEWKFEIRDGAALAMATIPTTTLTSQLIVGTSSTRDDDDYILNDTTDLQLTVPGMHPLLESNRWMTAVADQQVAFDAAGTLEDAALHHAENTDCASCHLAQGARDNGITELGFSDTLGAPAFERESHAITNLHAFGYLNDKVSVMQRTAVETAAVLDAMTALLAQ